MQCKHHGVILWRIVMPRVWHESHVTRHTSHVTRHTSHVTRHTSHVTRHTSRITRHTSHVTRHTSPVVHAGLEIPSTAITAVKFPAKICAHAGDGTRAGSANHKNKNKNKSKNKNKNKNPRAGRISTQVTRATNANALGSSVALPQSANVHTIYAVGGC